METQRHTGFRAIPPARLRKPCETSFESHDRSASLALDAAWCGAANSPAGRAGALMRIRNVPDDHGAASGKSGIGLSWDKPPGSERRRRPRNKRSRNFPHHRKIGTTCPAARGIAAAGCRGLPAGIRMTPVKPSGSSHFWGLVVFRHRLSRGEIAGRAAQSRR
jgi:hypothetical protein